MDIRRFQNWISDFPTLNLKEDDDSKKQSYQGKGNEGCEFYSYQMKGQTWKNILAAQQRQRKFFEALAENFQMAPAVLKYFWWKTEEIGNYLTNTSAF